MATDGGPAGAGRRRVMVGCELLQGALVVVIALWRPALPLLLVLVGPRAVAGQVFQPASRAAVPAAVPQRDLERANAAVGVATNGGEALGPLVAAVLLPVLEVRGHAAAGRLRRQQRRQPAHRAGLGRLLLDRTTPRLAFVAAGAAGLLATAATALALRRARS